MSQNDDRGRQQVASQLSELRRKVDEIHARIDSLSRVQPSGAIESPVSHLPPPAANRVASEAGRTPPIIVRPITPVDSLDSGLFVPPRVASTGVISSFVNDYNQARSHVEKRQAFEQRYGSLRLSASNAIARRTGKATTVEFGESGKGEYLAWRMSETGIARFALAPAFELVFQTYVFNAAGLFEIFDCHNADPRLRYRSALLEHPAIFERESSGQWTLVDRGALILQQSEEAGV